MELVNAVSQITQVQKKEKVAIIGCADSKEEAPWHLTEEFEFWGVNNLFLTFPKPFTRWFDIHQFSQEGGKWLRRGKDNFRGMPVNKYLEALGRLPFPIYMQQPNPLVPNVIVFPFAAMVRAFGSYYTNTISWEISLAMAEGFKEIHIYGVDMAVDCLAPESKVLTADLRWVPCGDVRVGDELMGFDEHSLGQGIGRKWHKTIVTKAHELQKPCYVVGLDDGTEIVASEGHGWLTHAENANRWKRTSELETNHHRAGRPTRVLKAVDPWTESYSYDAGYLAAAFDGEGCLCQTKRAKMIGSFSNQLSFAQRDNEMLENVSSLLKKNGYEFTKNSVCHSPTQQFTLKGGKTSIMSFLGKFRPKRLLPKFNPEAMGELQCKKHVAVLESRPIGVRPVVGLETTTKTFIADGFTMHNSEYHHQRPSCEYFLGMAVGRGIKVFIPDTCDLMKTRFLYGAQEPIELPFRNKISAMQKSMHERRAKTEQEMQLAQRKMFEYNGALAATAEIDKIYKNVTGG